MKKRMMLLIICVFLLFVACSEKPDTDAPKQITVIDLDEIDKTIATESISLKTIYHNDWFASDPNLKDNFIPWITDIKEGPDSTLYIFDHTNSRIVQLSKEGKFIRSIGGPGSGPGEFIDSYPNWIRSDKNIYICTNSGRRLQIFNLFGDYLRCITNLDIEGNSFAVGKNDVLLYPPPFRWIPPIPYMIFVRDSYGNEIYKIGSIKKNDPIVFTNKIRQPYHIIANNKSKYIWCVFQMLPVIRKYDYNNNYIEQIRFKSNRIEQLLKYGQDRLRNSKNPRVVKETSGVIILQPPSLLDNDEILIRVAGFGNLIIANSQNASFVRKKWQVIVQTADGTDNNCANNVRLLKLLGNYFGLSGAESILKDF